MVTLLLLWVGLAGSACTGGQKSATPIQYHDGPTDIDVESSRLRPVSRYRQPRQVNRYRYDKTEVDLATPLAPSTPQKPTPQR